ncbi:hypothetical protein [Streptomyces blastmyceticus]|uniref:Uncharacterized protein n=1 Tax=Streptomyces blastmyceticus TaxID=68180 RepID=A0ABN0XTG5_9ACTN
MKTLRRAATAAVPGLGVIALAVPAQALAADHTAGSGATDFIYAAVISTVQFLAAAT